MYGPDTEKALEIIRLYSNQKRAGPGIISFCGLNITKIPSLLDINHPINIIDLRGSKITEINLDPDLVVKRIYASKCPNLKKITSLPRSCTSIIDLSFCRDLQSISFLPLNLRSLRLESCISLKSLPLLPQTLQELIVFECYSLTIIPHRLSKTDREPTMPISLTIYAAGLKGLYVPYCNSISKNREESLEYVKQWEEWHRALYSIERIIKRTQTIKADLIMEVMRPCRIEKMITTHGIQALDIY